MGEDESLQFWFLVTGRRLCMWGAPSVPECEANVTFFMQFVALVKYTSCPCLVCSYMQTARKLLDVFRLEKNQ